MMKENKNTVQKLSIITTGGTIEKIYDEQDGTLENAENKGEIIKQKILKKLRLPYTDIEVHALMSKDSLHMTDQDRLNICQKISSLLPHQFPIVVLHGTDTMSITAEYCFQQLKALKVPLIFTGAMTPLGFDQSDAAQNVTEALLAAKILNPGVYIVFHNQVFQLPHVRKNREKRTFEYA